MKGLIWGLIESTLQNDRTWNGTRGISSDGIQRHKVRAVERTLDHAGCRRAQDHDSHSVESTGGGQGEPVDDYGDRPRAEYSHVVRSQDQERRCWDHPCQEIAGTCALASRR